MREIDVMQAQVGDMIGAPVVNAGGRVLLPKGAKLSPAVLSRLAGWGVLTICIEGDEPASSQPGDSIDMATVLDRRFAAWEDDDLMMAIKQIAMRHQTAAG